MANLAVELVQRIDERKDFFRNTLQTERQALERSLRKVANELRNELPASVLRMSLMEFASLSQFPNKLGLTDNDKERDEPVGKIRRLTRRNESLVVAQMAASPKFHPGLPETPANIREAVRKKILSPKDKKESITKISRTSDVFVDKTPNLNKIRRVTRATLRSSVIPRNPASTAKKCKTTSSKPNVGGILSLELDDGKVVDVDITGSPTHVIANMGPRMVGDLGKLFKAYAAKMTAFYKKCRVPSQNIDK